MLSGGRNERVISWLEARQSSSSSSQSPAGSGLQGWRRTADVEGNIPLWVSFPRDSMVRTDIKAQFKETGARAHTRVSVRVALSRNKYNEKKRANVFFKRIYSFRAIFLSKGGKEELMILWLKSTAQVRTWRELDLFFLKTPQSRSLSLSAAAAAAEAIMEKSKNFRIDALLADETNRCGRDLSPGLSSDSPAGSPVSCRRADTPPPRGAQLQTGIIPKQSVLNLPHPGLASLPQGAIPGMYPAPMYPLSALGGQHPAFAYTGFTHLSQTYPEHLKAAAMAGSLPLEHWIRAGLMMPRLPDYSCKCDDIR